MSDNLEPIEPADAKEMYLEQRKAEVSESTIQAHGYRLKHFVRWCEDVEELENLNTLTGRDLQRYKMWRREDGGLNNVTMVTRLSTLRVFINWCENSNAVAPGTHDKILMPSLAKNEDRRTAMLSDEAASKLIGAITQHLSQDVPEKIVSDRMNVGLDVLEKHYDRRTEREKADQRRDYLEDI